MLRQQMLDTGDQIDRVAVLKTETQDQGVSIAAHEAAAQGLVLRNMGEARRRCPGRQPRLPGKAVLRDLQATRPCQAAYPDHGVETPRRIMHRAEPGDHRRVGDRHAGRRGDHRQEEIIVLEPLAKGLIREKIGIILDDEGVEADIHAQARQPAKEHRRHQNGQHSPLHRPAQEEIGPLDEDALRPRLQATREG